jgi:hypothetical protein
VEGGEEEGSEGEGWDGELMRFGVVLTLSVASYYGEERPERGTGRAWTQT